VGLELADDALDVTGGGALVPTRPAGVVPGPEVPEELIGLAIGLHLLEALLALVQGVLRRLLQLVEEAHGPDPTALKTGPLPADGLLMRTEIERREVAWDAATATLTVGGRSTVVTCDPGDNECLLRTYLGLVAEQRDVTLGRGAHLRRDDVAVLAELLDLDDVDLEARLRRILHLSSRDAADLHRRLRRHRVAAAAVGVGLLATVPAGRALAIAADGTQTSGTPTSVAVVEVDPVSPDALDHPITVTFAPADVEVLEPLVAVAETPAPAPDPEPALEPEPEGEAEVGYSVTYERDPSYVPPEGVDIGDSMLIERDAANG
jgi:hypothetical protein